MNTFSHTLSSINLPSLSNSHGFNFTLICLYNSISVKDLKALKHSSFSPTLWELLPDDLVELILECVAVKPLLRLRCVCKKWKLTIDSQGFKERQLMRRRRLRGPDVLIMRLSYAESVKHEGRGQEVVLRESGRIAWNVSFTCGMFCSGSCDGLVCVYDLYTDSIVDNPATGWHRSFPLSNCQQLLIQRMNRERGDSTFPWPSLGFGRDKLRGTFKPVWLYNSSGFVLGGGDVVTTYCEVFDFSTNAWRYVVPASPYPINAYYKPVHLDGSLYWFTQSDPPMLLSFDLHTETFHVICNAPFPAHPHDPRHITMCILDNCLCVSQKKQLTQVIWSFDSSDNTWDTLCSFDLSPTFSWYRKSDSLLPIAILNKGRLLLQGAPFLQGHGSMDPLIIYDLHNISYDLLCRPHKSFGSVDYFQSLFSA